MSVLTQKLHLLKTGGSEETASIYTTAAECPEPRLQVGVNGMQCYVKLGNVDDYYATSGRVHRNADNTDYAILNQYKVSDFPNEWGEFSRVDFTCGIGEGQVSDWQYIFSMHFSNGCIPLIVSPSGTISRNDNLFQYNASSEFNSATWYNGWVNAIAKNRSGSMVWTDANGIAYRSITNTAAQAAGFNGGRNTVFADDTFSSTLQNGTLTIYKNGVLFVTYNV